MSGIPSFWRGRRVFSVLQTFADGSFGQKYTMLAGYLGYEEKWEDFADAWQAVLDQKPKLKCFKMKEALSLTGAYYLRLRGSRDSLVRRRESRAWLPALPLARRLFAQQLGCVG